MFSQITFSPAYPLITFTSPVFITHPGDGTNRVFIVQQNGTIRVMNNDSSASSAPIFLNITNKVIAGGESGLLGLAFHPNYSSNRYFYVYYTRAGDGTLIVSRFTTFAGNPNKADSLSELNLLTVPHPNFSNHNGGALMFGADGYLYAGMGDGGSGGDPNNNGQNVNSMLGKIHRIDVNNPSGGNNYGIPPGNPFAAGGGRAEIFCWGLRNPWRISQDPVTKTIYCGDVGQGFWEEVDTISVGKNYGWRCYEGNHPYNTSGCGAISNYTFPIKEYYHTGGACSITGGYVYRGSRIPVLTGRYIYGDYCNRNVWKLFYNSGVVNDTVLIGQLPSNLLSFGVDKNNEIYACCANGVIYKFNYIPIGIKGNSNHVPGLFKIEQNYPNPFNPATQIQYTVEKQAHVKIKIYDLLGNEIQQLVNEKKEAGLYSIKWQAENFPSAVYFCRIEAEGQFADIKMVLIK